MPACWDFCTSLRFSPVALSLTPLFHLFGGFLSGRRASRPCSHCLHPLGLVQHKTLHKTWARWCLLDWAVLIFSAWLAIARLLEMLGGSVWGIRKKKKETYPSERTWMFISAEEGSQPVGVSRGVVGSFCISDSTLCLLHWCRREVEKWQPWGVGPLAKAAANRQINFMGIVFIGQESYFI